MRKYFALLVAVGFTANLAWAGGIMTNTNQSASYIRMLDRDASMGIDAVYYNPAGLTSLADGFHFSLNNQSVIQTRNINNALPILNQNEFKGTVSAPLFPSVYAAYKTGKLAFSFGFNPVGGGGGAALLRRADDGKAVPAPVVGELTVGRSAPAGLVVTDPRLSRRHFRMALSGDVAFVEDLDSRNGTWVNGERVQKRALRDGDVIEAGGQVFVFLGASD